MNMGLVARYPPSMSRLAQEEPTYLSFMQRCFHVALTLLLSLAFQASWTQTAVTYNPDSGGNGHVDLGDLLSFLAAYDLPWPPAVELDCRGGVEFEGYTYATEAILDQVYTGHVGCVKD